MTLLELFKLLRKHLALVVVLPVVLAIATAGFSWGLMQNQYTATVSVYVLTAKDDASSSSTTAYNEDRKSTRLNSSHIQKSRMPSSA